LKHFTPQNETRIKLKTFLKLNDLIRNLSKFPRIKSILFFSTAAASTTIITKSEVAKALQDFFAGNNVAASKTVFINALESLGANTSLASTLADDYVALGASLIPNPNATQQAAIIQNVEKLLNDSIAFALSQPGLGNLTTDPDIINDPRFIPFVDYFNQLKGAGEYLKANPDKAFDFFQDPASFADFYMQVTDVSRLVVEKKMMCKCLNVQSNMSKFTIEMIKNGLSRKLSNNFAFM
jgi:hypothetical protein